MQRLRTLWREHRWFRWSVEIALVVALYVGIRAFQTRGVVRGPAPPLSGETLEGEVLSLADLRGEPVMVHFWATWCGVCRAEEHNVKAVAEDHRVVTVALRSGTPAELSRYVREHGLRAPVIADPTGALSSAWGVESLPTTFILGPDGTIEHVEVGYTTELGMRARLWLAGL